MGATLLTNASARIDTYLYEFTPQSPLEFQTGDILGLHTPWNNMSQVLVLEQRGGGPPNVRIITSVISPSSTIGTLDTLFTETSQFQDFPLITPVIGKLYSQAHFTII